MSQQGPWGLLASNRQHGIRQLDARPGKVGAQVEGPGPGGDKAFRLQVSLPTPTGRVSSVLPHTHPSNFTPAAHKLQVNSGSVSSLVLP